MGNYETLKQTLFTLPTGVRRDLEHR